MTGGTVVILGPFGYNLGAGMTGGQAYVYDPEHELVARMNRQLVDATLLDDAAGRRAAVPRRAPSRAHGFARAPAAMLADWDAALRCFWRVAPVERGRAHRAGQRGPARRRPLTRWTTGPLSCRGAAAGGRRSRGATRTARVDRRPLRSCW